MEYIINPAGSGAYTVVSQIYAPLSDDDGNIIVDDNGNGIGTYYYDITVHVNEHYGYQFVGATVNGTLVSTVADFTFTANQDAVVVFNFIRINTRTALKADSYNVWRGFVKDALNLEDPPKAFLTILSHNIRQDLLTTANSEFNCLEVPDNVSNGDILLVTNPYGVTRYIGIIKAIEGTEIQTYQMQHFYSGKWVYDNSGDVIGIGDDKSWFLEKFSKKGANPVPSDFSGETPTDTTTVLDSAMSVSFNWGDNYSAKATAYLYCSNAFSQSLTIRTDDGGSVTLNGTLLGKPATVTDTSYTYNFQKGWNILEVCWTENSGNDGFNYTPKIYNLSGIDKMTSVGSQIIEDSVVEILTKYSNGYMLNSTYQDTLIAQEKSSVAITANSATMGRLETKDANTVEELETFIYGLYQNYNILLDFNIAYSGANSVTVWKPNYSTIKIGNNTNAIVNISPITKVEETNRLIIYAKDGTYRNTYVAKSDGTIVSEPSATTNRFNVVNTKIVFSDDEETDLIAANLPSDMYNHKLTFTLRLNNKLYQFDDLKLGRPLNIWIDGEYYSTIITGMSYKKDNNQPVMEVEYVCGMVRTSLSDKLSLRLGVI